MIPRPPRSTLTDTLFPQPTRFRSDAELRSTQRGDQVCSFNVGVNQGYGDKKSTNWYRVSLWGKRGESLQPYLLKGVKVAISGEFETSEYEGKTQLNIRANGVDIMSSRKDQNERSEEHTSELQSLMRISYAVFCLKKKKKNKQKINKSE